MLAYYSDAITVNVEYSSWQLTASILMLVISLILICLFIALVVRVATMERLLQFWLTRPNPENPICLMQIEDGLLSKNSHVRLTAIQQAGLCGTAGIQFLGRLQRLREMAVAPSNEWLNQLDLAIKRVSVGHAIQKTESVSGTTPQQATLPHLTPKKGLSIGNSNAPSVPPVSNSPPPIRSLAGDDPRSFF